MRISDWSSDVCSSDLSMRIADDSTPLADEAAHDVRQRRELLEAIEALPRRQRTALELGLFQGMALKEIGRRMGISESRVCQQIGRASCRERVCQYVSISVVAVSLKTKKKYKKT